MTSLTNLKNRYQRKVGEKERTEKQIENCKSEIKQTQKRISRAERAKDVVREVAHETQSQLEYKITSTVSHALSAVFDDPYDFKVNFELRRGKTECDLFFLKNGEQIPPLEASGYGAVDIASFALRAACWSMSRDTRPVFILDEPFKHLKGVEENRRAIAMVNQISRELGIQIIMVSDERAPYEDILEESDQVFRVTIKNDISQVQREN